MFIRLSGCFCFVPRSSVSEIKGEKYDPNETYSYDYSGESFYYALAERALKSEKEMFDFLKKLCEIAGVKKFSCRQENLKHMALEQLLTAYRSALWILKLEASKDKLINWESAGMEDAVKNSDVIHCAAYMKHVSRFGDAGISQIPDTYIEKLWQMFAEKNFADDTAVIVLLKASSKKNEKLYYDFLEQLKKCGKLSEICQKDNSVLSLLISKIPSDLNYFTLLKRLFSNDEEIGLPLKEKIFENVKELFKVCQNLENKCELYDSYANFGSFGEQWKEFVCSETSIVDVSGGFNSISELKTKRQSSAYLAIYVNKWFDSTLYKLREYQIQSVDNIVVGREDVAELCDLSSQILKGVIPFVTFMSFLALCKANQHLKNY